MNIPELGTIKHGKYRDLSESMASLNDGESLTVPLSLRNGKGIISKRLGIKVKTRKNGDLLDIYRVA
jgi:hypothetical protein